LAREPAGASAADGGGARGAGPTERLQARVNRLATLSYELILELRVAFGTAAGLIDRLTGLQEELSLNGIVAELDARRAPSGRAGEAEPLDPHQQVMPALK
jgi:hypothetical protein